MGEGQSLPYKRTFTVTRLTEIAVDSKYIEGLLKLLLKFGGVKQARALAMDIDDTKISFNILARCR